MEKISSMKRSRNWRPTDGYEPACPKNMFLDLKSKENDREEYLSDKVREYLQSLGMLSESSKLDNLFYSPLEQVIQKSNFWTQNNDYDEADIYRYMGEDALQTDAAYELNQALMMFFKENNIPIVLVVESTDPSNNSKTVLHPKHSNYPNKVILGGFQSLTKSSRILIVLHMATFSDEFNPDDVNSSSISRQVARIIRHEVIHADQLDKRSKNQNISRKKAKKAYQDQGLVPGPGEDTRTQYLSSHIEIDAYAHEIAEELYDLAGYEGALDILRNKKKVLDYPVSEQTKEYLYDYADEDFSFKLVKKVYTHLENFKNSKVLESRIIKRILKEGLTSYDVEDVYSTAQLAHLGQKRRTGEDYFTHPRAVANIVRKYYPKDTRAYLVALLHDTIEDTEEVGNLSVKELTSMIGASIGDPDEAKDILDAVNALTHAKNQPYTEYVQGLSSNPMALKVKLADMMHNLSSTPTERQKAKYEKAINDLSQRHSGNIPGISMKHVSDLLNLAESRMRSSTTTELLSSRSEIFERSYVTNVLGLDIPLNESYPYTPSFERRIIQEQLLMENWFSDILQKGKDVLLSAKDGIAQYGKEAWSILSGFYRAIKEGKAKQLASAIATKTLKQFFKPIRSALKFLVEKLPQWGMPTFAKAAQKALDFIQGAVDGAKKLKGWKAVAGFSGVAIGMTWLWNAVGEYIEELKELVGGWAAGMKLSLTEADDGKIQKIKDWLKETGKNMLAALVGDKVKSIIKTVASAPGVAAFWEAAKAVGEGAQLVIDALAAGTKRFVDRDDDAKKMNASIASQNESVLRKLIREQLENEVIMIPPPPPDEYRAYETLVVNTIPANPDISDTLYEMLDNDITSLFHSILVGNGHEVKRKEVKKLKNSIKPIVKFHKIYFNAPRPSQLAARMGVDFEYDHLESAQTPSYPSGHAAQGYYMAEMLSRKYPKCAEELFGLADLIADSRLERGVHLPSDIEAGKLMAQKLASRSV